MVAYDLRPHIILVSHAGATHSAHFQDSLKTELTFIEAFVVFSPVGQT